MASRRSRMSDCCPDACEECANNVPKDRREDYGDVCMRWIGERIAMVEEALARALEREAEGAR